MKSTAIPSVTCGVSRQLAESRSAAVRRMPVRGTRALPSPLVSFATAGAPDSMARCTSSLVTRPSGPVPWSPSASMPWRSARRRATGVTRLAGALAGAGAGASGVSGISSPASPIQASVVPTGYSTSTSPTRRKITPSTGESTSTVALSVSTARSGSPSFTVAPSATNHSTIRPFSMVWPRAARRNCTAIYRLPGPKP